MWLVLVALMFQPADFQADGIKALDAKQYDTAVELFTKAVAADSKDYAPRFHLALAYSLLGKDAEAIPQYKSALELKPGLYEAEINLGICLLRTKDVDGAIPYLRHAAEQKPKEVQPAYYLASALLEKKQWTEAETYFREAAALDSSYRDSLLQVASSYEENHQAAEAIAIYREFPENPGALEHLGSLLTDAGRAGEAIPPLEKAVGSSPTVANRVALAQAYLGDKQTDKGTQLLAQIVAGEPRDYQLRMFYGRTLRDQHKYSGAAPQFVAATQLKPDAPEAWNELATVLILAEQYPQAIAALDRVRALGAETSAHSFFRAMAFDHLHQFKDALANYNKFLETSQGKSPDEEFKARQRVRTIQKELDKR